VRELPWLGWKGQRTSQRTAQGAAIGFDDPGQEQQRGLSHQRCLRNHIWIEKPIWGERFNPIINLPHYVDPSYWKMAGPQNAPEVVVRTRILAVIDYLSRIQQK
jgi:hypothetical protein